MQWRFILLPSKLTLEMSPDTKKTIGGKISALASHVTHLSECHRRYGSNAKTKRVSGTVLSVEIRPTKTGRSSTWIHAEFDFGGRTKKRWYYLFHLSGQMWWSQ